MRTSTLVTSGLLLVVLAGFRANDKPSVYVTIETDVTGEHPKGKAKELVDSANDVRNELEKRRDIVTSSDATSADIVVTILDRRIEIDQIREDYGGGQIQNHYQSRHLIVYRTSIGKLSQDSEYFMAGSLVTWKRVAGGVSKQIERWALDNMEAIWRAREWKR